MRQFRLTLFFYMCLCCVGCKADLKTGETAKPMGGLGWSSLVIGILACAGVAYTQWRMVKFSKLLREEREELDKHICSQINDLEEKLSKQVKELQDLRRVLDRKEEMVNSRGSGKSSENSVGTPPSSTFYLGRRSGDTLRIVGSQESASFLATTEDGKNAIVHCIIPIERLLKDLHAETDEVCIVKGVTVSEAKSCKSEKDGRAERRGEEIWRIIEPAVIRLQ